MIIVSYTDYELLMRVLRDGPMTAERQDAIKALKIAMMEGITRELKYANTTPALLRNQAN